MFAEAAKRFNWVDLCVLILVLRICYIAMKNGLPPELFKLLGVILAAYLSLHYYSVLTQIAAGRQILRSVPGQFLTFLLFIILAVSGYLILKILRDSVFMRFFKLEAIPLVNHWGGFALGVFRAFLTVSLLVFILAISPADYLKNSVKSAYSARPLVKIAPRLYASVWDGLLSKFLPQEQFNSAVPEVQKSLEPAQ